MQISLLFRQSLHVVHLHWTFDKCRQRFDSEANYAYQVINPINCTPISVFLIFFISYILFLFSLCSRLNLQPVCQFFKCKFNIIYHILTPSNQSAHFPWYSSLAFFSRRGRHRWSRVVHRVHTVNRRLRRSHVMASRCNAGSRTAAWWCGCRRKRRTVVQRRPTGQGTHIDAVLYCASRPPCPKRAKY